MISLKDISKEYKNGLEGQKVLKKVSLEIEAGDFISIRGSSGSGKSTLLNILGFLDVPTSGSYFLSNNEVSNITFDELADLRNKEIGFVFQSYNLIEELNVRENIALPYLYSKKNRSDERILQLIEKVGLKGKEERFPSELSGGQQQRVALARALILEPSLLLLDEPTGNLDQKMSQKIMELIVEFHKSGHTVCLVSHEPEFAELAKKQYEMIDGDLKCIA